MLIVRTFVFFFFFLNSQSLLFADILAIIGPSGTGKTTISEYLVVKYPFIKTSISCTTRKPRNTEIPGRDYNFLSVEEFIKLKKDGAFFEWTTSNNNYYGTLKSQLEESLKRNSWIIKIINADGVEKLRNAFGRHVKVLYITVPTLDILRKRLEDRGTESKEKIEQRLRNAVVEMNAVKYYDYKLVNDDLSHLKNKVDRIITELIAGDQDE